MANFEGYRDTALQEELLSYNDESESETGESSNESYEEDDEEVKSLTELTKNLKIGKEYRRFGLYECNACNNSWGSARTYCVYKGIKNIEPVFQVCTSKWQINYID